MSSVADRLKGILTAEGEARSTPVTDVTHDSRQVRSGTIFVAIRGATVDGHRFVDGVAGRGAPAVISELEAPAGFPIPWIQVENARVALAEAAAFINRDPSHELTLVGITGTNGKTTTTYLCRALAEAAGIRSAMLTTVEYRIGDKSVPAIRTTPEASDTNRFLRSAVDDGCRVAFMEASSQAIDLHRCDALSFEIAVFTNLTRDHLDHHGSMEEYFAAKRKLFDGSLGDPPHSSLINMDDEWGERLAKEVHETGRRVVTVSQFTSERPAYSDLHLSARNIEVSLLKGTSFTMELPGGSVEVVSPLVGRPHVYNMLTATAVALEMGIETEEIVRGLSTCVGAPGRFERVPHDGDFAIVVDYAHSDDALLNTLRTARELTDGRIITVFGCGGDRDRTKRKPMAIAAGDNSDLVFATNDNPRTEDPMRILAEVEEGLEETKSQHRIIPDRRAAIFEAVGAARPGDVVVIAGKGHETYQIIGNDKFHFDDREVAAEAARERLELG